MATQKSVGYGNILVPPKKSEEWTKMVHKLVRGMNQSLTLLFEGVDEDIEPDTNSTQKEDNVLSSETPLPVVAETFSKHCEHLNVFLSTPTNGPVKIPLNFIVDVLARCLKVTSLDVKSKPSLRELGELLTQLHNAALLVLAQLIISCKSIVLPRSRTIIDMCLSALAGSNSAKAEAKSMTRACTYQVISLMVTMFGWGRYLQSNSRHFIQDLAADIQIQESKQSDSEVGKDPENVPTTSARQDVEQIAQRKGKKKKKGKKQKGDSYNELCVPGGDNKDGLISDMQLFNLQATQAALKLSQLICQRAEFSQVEPLIRCILNTARILQRGDSPKMSAYKSEETRLVLYAAVFSCSMVRLGSDASRKATINHFQALNLALTVLTSASHSEPAQYVRNSCSQSIVVMRSISTLNPPIVRKVRQDDQDQMITRDVSEVEQEVEKLTQEKKSLWQQLVDAQVELETQNQELLALRQAAVEFNKVRSSGGTLCNGSNNTTVNNDINDTLNDDEEEATSHDDTENTSVRHVQPEREFGSDNETKGSNNEHESVDQDEKSSPSVKTSLVSLKPAGKSKKKRSLQETHIDDLQEQKKQKIGENPLVPTQTEDNTEIAEDVEAMIADFVDVDANGS